MGFFTLELLVGSGDELLGDVVWVCIRFKFQDQYYVVLTTAVPMGHGTKSLMSPATYDGGFEPLGVLVRVCFLHSCGILSPHLRRVSGLAILWDKEEIHH